MKTAMQELMGWMEQTEFMVNQGFIDKIHECLEKEKKQIIDAHTNGHNNCYEYNFLKNSANEISIRDGEDYYNETYKAK